MAGGTIGEMFAALAFAAALVSSLSFFGAVKTQGPEKKSWERMGVWSFWIHAGSVFGVIATLFYLIYTHQFQYHYVWSHSSNELPVHYMISCFWEGQEGSFLLWSFWHAVLGGIVAFRRGPWRNVVLAVVTSVNLVLSSMILGVYVPAWVGTILFVLAVALPMGFLAYRFLKNKDSILGNRVLHVAGIAVGIVALGLVLSGQTGLLGNESTMSGVLLAAMWGVTILLIAYFIYLLVAFILNAMQPEAKEASSKEFLALLLVGGLALVAGMMEFGSMKIGSSPFILLKDVFKDAPIFASNPDFVPPNGNGLNPLLQNYWMVIHPPTLFLGFASTIIPFAYVIGGLVTRQYTQWLKPAAPWTIFSVAILGVGIIMGGYWAYETLNFGGYWNWDPVENSSFVPWILGIASLHAMVAYRRSKAFLKTTMLLVMSVFIFVLYSTFLTRSGILGETSVHTFTDLGLSGQLLLLLFLYLVGLAALFMGRLKVIPVARREVSLKSTEFVIFLGVLTLLFAGIVITVFTSIPVFNQILGTNWATPKDGPFFYYRWTIWFAIILALLSGLGQFMYWRRKAGKSLQTALMRPYAVALGLAAVMILSILLFTNWEFGFEGRYREWKELADNAPNVLTAIFRYLRLGFYVFADEVLLFSALFMIASNLDVLIHLLTKNKRSRQVTGGSIAHVGFGMILLGLLFSSGYDQVISKNINPGELASLPQDARIDNIMLQRGVPKNIIGYQVTYIGKKEAQAPVSDLEIIQDDGQSFKVAFRDKTGDQFAFVMPRQVFSDKQGDINMPFVEEFLNDKMEFLKPKHINDRTLYGLEFVPRSVNRQTGDEVLDEESSFVLYPEAEVNPSMGLVAHPSRKILPHRDVYVHVSTIPKEEEEAQFEFYNWEVSIGDTAQTSRAMVFLDHISSEPIEGTEYELIAKAHLRVVTDQGRVVEAKPLYRIDKNNRVSVQDAYIEDIYTSFAFVGVNTETGKISLTVQEQLNPSDDIVVIQALAKPWINILWLGTFVLVFGFGMAIVRRIREDRKTQGTTEEEAAEMVDGLDTFDVPENKEHS